MTDLATVALIAKSEGLDIPKDPASFAYEEAPRFYTLWHMVWGLKLANDSVRYAARDLAAEPDSLKWFATVKSALFTAKSKQRDAEEAARLTAMYENKGGKVTTVDPLKSSGLSAADHARLARGLKVATPEEIVAERDRRLLKAVQNSDVELIAAILAGKHNRAIKFDIDNGRIDADGKWVGLVNGGVAEGEGA